MDPKLRIRKYGAILAITLLGILLGYALFPFWSAILGALILFALFRPVQKYFTKKLKLNRSFSAILVILITIFSILIPVGITVAVIGNGITNYYSQNKKHFNDLPSLIPDSINQDTEIIEGVTIRSATEDMELGEVLKSTANTVKGFILSAISSISNLGLQLLIMYLIFYYLLKDMDKLTQVFYRYSPFKKRNSTKLLTEFHNMTYSNVVGAGVNAIAQGVVLGIGFWIFGLPDGVFWGFVGGILSFIPVLGPVLVWVPAGIISILSGDYFAGIGILIWGGVLVSLVDNVIRLAVNSKLGHIHPLITLLGIFIGLPLFGFLGLVLGPALLSFFLLLVKMYREEFILPDHPAHQRPGGRAVHPAPSRITHR